MIVRTGFSMGAAGNVADLDRFAEVVDELERLGFDSIWVPEVVTATSLDPLAALAFAAGRTTKLKLGSHLAVPGRAPARLAKELATLDRLSRGRLLLTFVIGLAQPAELSAYGVQARQRTAILDETLSLLRRWWAGETVDHDGPFFQYQGVAIEPRPAQQPLEVWFGGMTPSSLRRCGELADGWIPGFIDPIAAGTARRAIQQAAADAGRTIDPEHFGMNVQYRRGPLDGTSKDRLRQRFPALSDADIDELVPDADQPGALGDRLEAYLAEGFSKFVLRPAAPVTDWPQELGRLAIEALPHQTRRPG
ncbi:MAG: LLM class flavin-dependent oxidoreductase [Acidimicrobiales bacterium]